MLSLDNLPRSVYEQTLENFVPDRYEGLRGPSVAPYFLAELERIDARLVLRWHPYQHLYMVFLRMPATRKVWSQPVHIVRDGSGRYRPPATHDLDCIRKASWHARHEGATAWIEHMDRVIAQQDRDSRESRDRAAQKWASEVARRYDLNVGDFKDMGVTREVVGANKRNRHKGSKKR